MIACYGTGLDRIEFSEAACRSIIVRNTPDDVTDDTADFAIAVIDATTRPLAEADRPTKARL